MNILHSKSITIADGDNSNIVRPSDWNSAHIGAVSLAGNTSNLSTWQGTNLIVSGGSNITVGISENSLQIRGNAPPVFSVLDPVGFVAAERIAGQIGNAVVHLIPVTVPASVVFDRVFEPLLLSLNTGSTNTVTITQGLAIYRYSNDSVISLLSASSESTVITINGTANTASLSGQKFWTWGFSGSLTPGQYVIANWSRTTGSAATISNLIASNMNTALSGYLGSIGHNSILYMPFLGSFGTTTNSFPNSIHASQLAGSAAVNLRPKLFFLSSGTYA